MTAENQINRTPYSRYTDADKTRIAQALNQGLSIRAAAQFAGVRAYGKESSNQINLVETQEQIHIPIERGGGKLEATRALAEAGFPVPKSVYLYHGDLGNERLLAATKRHPSNSYCCR